MQRHLVATLLAAPPPGLWRPGSAPSLSPLQGKEEFEKTQKELLEKGNIMRQGKGQLELQQVRTGQPLLQLKLLICQSRPGAEPGPPSHALHGILPPAFAGLTPAEKAWCHCTAPWPLAFAGLTPAEKAWWTF